VARAEGVDPDLFYHLVRVESSFRPDVVSAAGAVGLAQLLPSTARALDPTVERADLFAPDTNLRLGARYLRRLLDRYRGNVRLALLAYNRGPTRVSRILREGGDPANGYARRVLADDG
jgi:soluble lytic murein transglycosylase-like protein